MTKVCEIYDEGRAEVLDFFLPKPLFIDMCQKKSIKRYPNTPRFLGDCGTVGGNEGFWGGWGSSNRRATHGKKPKLGYHLDDEMER